MSYLVNEALLRLIKPLIALLLAVVLYWVVTGLLGEPGSALPLPGVLAEHVGVHPARRDRHHLTRACPELAAAARLVRPCQCV